MNPGSIFLRTRGSLLGRAALGTVLAALCSVTASAQTLVMRAEISGQEVVPPVTTTALGTAWFVIDLDANTLTFDLTFDQLVGNEIAAHIEGFAPAGANGTMKFDLGPGKHKSGVWNYPQADEQSLIDGLAYVLIQSDVFPAGEVRGQIGLAVSARVFVASLDGAQEVPPVTTTAKGTGVFEVNTQTNVLSFQITYADLSSAETQAHLHGYVPAGQTAPVVFDLGLGFHKKGTWTYPQGDEASILANLLYANVHSANNTNGEVRGQVELKASDPGTYCTAKLNSQACTPAIGFTGMPTLTAPDNFRVNAKDVLNQSLCALMWSPIPDNVPFMNGTMCIDAATQAVLGVAMSGGNALPPDCSGQPMFDFTHAKMTSVGLVAGDLVFTQWWYRDMVHIDGTGFGTTDALVVVILP
jgi:hypothetical protein